LNILRKVSWATGGNPEEELEKMSCELDEAYREIDRLSEIVEHSKAMQPWEPSKLTAVPEVDEDNIDDDDDDTFYQGNNRTETQHMRDIAEEEFVRNTKIFMDLQSQFEEIQIAFQQEHEWRLEAEEIAIQLSKNKNNNVSTTSGSNNRSNTSNNSNKNNSSRSNMNDDVGVGVGNSGNNRESKSFTVLTSSNRRPK
jgi:hypothetical protein